MSLFKLNTIWNASFPRQQFDQRHLILGTINKQLLIAIASYQGFLRLYLFQPNQKNTFKQVLEKNFQQPIIDVKLIMHPDPSVRGTTLGVLLFKNFIYLSLEQEIESCMLVSKSMVLQVQPSFSILPSPLSLTSLNSSIISLNPKQIHPIKQSDPIYPFAMSMNDFYYMDGQDLVKNKGDIQQWRIIIGRVRNIHVIRDLVILIGDLDIWQVKEAKIINAKRLEEDLACAVIAHKIQNDFNIIICNFIRQMLVYSSEYSLLWAVKLDFTPIRLIICQHQSLKGALVFLTDQSSIQVAYAGTQISQKVLKGFQQQINFQRVQSQTQYFIKKSKGQPQQQKSVEQKNENQQHYINLKLSFSTPQQTSQFVDKDQQLFRSLSSNKLIKCVLTVEMLAETQLNNVIVSVAKPNNIFISNSHIQLNTLKGKQTVKFDVFISKEKFPYQMYINVNIKYQKGKLTKLLQKDVLIPMSFQSSVCSFQSLANQSQKITFKCMDETLPSFNELFPDVIQRGSGQQTKSITFIYVNGVTCSIVYNKNATKIYAALCYLFIQFISRIQNYLKKIHKKPAFQIDVSLKQLETQIREYHSYRELLKNKYIEVTKRTDEFKKAQKKLLLKTKQKISSLQHINKLLQFCYQKMLSSTSSYQSLLQQSQIVNHNFQIALKLVFQLVYHRSSASPKAIKTSQTLIKFDALTQNPLDDQGWADRLTKSTAHYLNKKYQPTVENVQKLVTWVITKVNNGDFN